jgi:hypothetical protein
MNPDKPLIRKRAKFTGGAKITLAAAGILSFVGGWNLIARVEQKDVQASEPPAPVPGATLPPATPTPWPTIPPLVDLPAIPTLVPTLTTAGFPVVESNNPDDENEGVQAAPLPTLVPLPTLAPLPVLQAPVPPPPPPMPAPSSGSQNQSGGS